MADQIKSKERVQEHGEVFTNPREVNAMLDMVATECERIESRFLEPACGTGNFLIEVLHRKMDVVKTRYAKSPQEYLRYAFLAASSLYGVELLEDNAQECRERLCSYAIEQASKTLKTELDPAFTDAITYVFERNICCGDALTLKTADGEAIIFSEWSLVTGDKVKRRDFRLDELLEGKGDFESGSLFSADMTALTEWEYDTELKAYIPKPIREYPLCDWREVRACG